MTTISSPSPQNYSSHLHFEAFSPNASSLPTSVEKLKDLENGACEVLFNGDTAIAYFVYNEQNPLSRPSDPPFLISNLSFIEKDALAIEAWGELLIERITSLARQYLSRQILITISDSDLTSTHYLMKWGFTKQESSHPLGAHLFEKYLYSEKPPLETQMKKRKKMEPSSTKRGTSKISERKEVKSKTQVKSKERKTYHQLSMKKEYILQIRDQKKTVEGRISERQILKYRPGDTIRFFYFSKPADDVTCQITDIKRFSSFREMLIDSGIHNCLPNSNSLEDAVEAYNQIPKYQEKAQKSGVTAIHLKVMK